VKAVGLVASALALVLAEGCSEDRPDVEPGFGASSPVAQPLPAWTVHSDRRRGYSVGLPPSWQRAGERMSRIGDPRELVTVGTRSLRWRRTNCEAFAGAAGASMGPRDVVVTVWERGFDDRSAWRDFPRRPQRFGPVGRGEPAAAGCREPAGTRTHWRNFTDAGRHFHTLVRIGRRAPRRRRAQAWRILDSLRFDRGQRPGWRASG
jgi:hypothetical protein